MPPSAAISSMRVSVSVIYRYSMVYKMCLVNYTDLLYYEQGSINGFVCSGSELGQPRDEEKEEEDERQQRPRAAAAAATAVAAAATAIARATAVGTATVTNNEDARRLKTFLPYPRHVAQATARQSVSQSSSVPMLKAPAPRGGDAAFPPYSQF